MAFAEPRNLSHRQVEGAIVTRQCEVGCESRNRSQSLRLAAINVLLLYDLRFYPTEVSFPLPVSFPESVSLLWNAFQ